MSGRCSPGSAGSTTGSTGPGTGTSSSASPTPTGGPCSPPAGPECPSTTTYETYVRATRPHGARGGPEDDERWEESPTTPPLTPHGTGSVDPALAVTTCEAWRDPPPT